MNPLLKRQIRKYLGDELSSQPEVQKFLSIINKSYDNYDDQFSMLQRAMSISSQELFDANAQLTEEAKQQRIVINRLTDATKILRSITYTKEVGKNSAQELSGLELAKHIEQQANQISKIEKQREIILSDLEKSNQELRDYAHVVSHDLKSPLRTINTLINWVHEDSTEILNPTIKKHLEGIDKNIEKMDNLISGILEYSVVDKKKEHTTTVDVQQLVTEIISLLQIPNHISVSILNPLPTIHADRMRLKQVFQNLISNAIHAIDKPKGMITIGCTAAKDAWKFEIQDNGKGIAEKYHQKIFKIFQSLDEAKESTGIGLAIVKKIIDFYHGKIWVTSEPKIGTTFHFTIKN